ncbi:MAG: methyltransferase domain-containing protein [Acidimicrobiales bacterium]
MTIDQQLAEWWLTNLETSARFDAPWVADAVAWLVETSDRPGASGPPQRVLDVGCGAGGAACAFAAALGSGVVTGFDRDPRLLAIARRRAADAGLAGQIFGWTCAGVDALPVETGSADLVWASGVVHHLPDQQAAIGTLAALLRPGGRLALVEGGLPVRCLPFDIGLGRVGLESRLDEARSRWFADMRGELRGPPWPYGWPEGLRRAGLIDVRARSFLAEVPPPLDDFGRQVAERHLSSALSELGDRLAPDDRDTIGRLLDPDDTAYVGRRDDLMVTAVRTLNVGTAA